MHFARFKEISTRTIKNDCWLVMQIYCNDIINIVRRIYYSNNNHDDNEKKVTTHPLSSRLLTLLPHAKQNITQSVAIVLFTLLC